MNYPLGKFFWGSSPPAEKSEGKKKLTAGVYLGAIRIFCVDTCPAWVILAMYTPAGRFRGMLKWLPSATNVGNSK